MFYKWKDNYKATALFDIHIVLNKWGRALMCAYDFILFWARERPLMTSDIRVGRGSKIAPKSDVKE